MFASLETVIVDEIHAIAATKRGAHLFLSLERVEALRRGRRPLQRIGLSATQRPLEEIARLLGGGEITGRSGVWKPRPVAIVDAGSKKAFALTVEVPVEDMARLAQEQEQAPSGSKADAPTRPSIWPSIYPRLVELVRAHRSTMIFVNSRRLAERLAAAINDSAGEEIALAHHGSVAREKRQQIEERLKRGELPAIVATSSLELGIDMGAVDLVIQIEAPPSIASGMQRIGRAGHSVGEVSRGNPLPQVPRRPAGRGGRDRAHGRGARRGDRLPAQSAGRAGPADRGDRRVGTTAESDAVDVAELYRLVRRAAPFADLSRSSFEGVLDMLSGRYPSDEFAELRPRLTWDRVGGTVRAREGAQRIAVVNAGTIPDRGLYGVFLGGAGDDPRRSLRVGELDEEMVFESRPGDVFVLGASSWRILEITHDRVTVSPAPGEPGRMPFWHGDRPGRPTEFGEAIGQLSRDRWRRRRSRKRSGVCGSDTGWIRCAAANLVAYLREQAQATGEVPSDRTIVVERYRDEIGDWRVCVLSPFGARVHAPWATAVTARLEESTAGEVEAIWSDDGMVFRLPESDEPPEVSLLIPAADEIEDRVVRSLGQTSLFAARFRENAARALLLPRRHPGRRSPLWAQRRRAADLLAVAARYGSFPILLETYRECLRDVFDLPGLVDILRRIESRRIRVVTVDSHMPSPFAASLLFSYVANFIYDGDAPLAERRAQALSVDQAQLRELLGEAELRELLDADAIEGLERSLQRLEGYKIRHPDGLHDLLLALGDLTEEEIRGRSAAPEEAPRWIAELLRDRRAVRVAIAGEARIAAAEDAGRFRDALGAPPPPGVPDAFLEPVRDALGDLLSRYARTHGPFRVQDVAARFGIPEGTARLALDRLEEHDRVIQGDFLPGGRSREWCEPGVLRAIKRRSLAKLRREVEPVEPVAFARFLMEWQSVGSPRPGLEALLSVVEQLQGCPIPASVLETEVLPARVDRYRPSDLDALCAAGEVVWRGLEPLGPSDGRIALYLPDRLPLLARPATPAEGELAEKIRRLLASRGALFFPDLLAEIGGFPGDLLAALWDLVWAGEIGNDTLTPLRSLLRGSSSSHRRRAGSAGLRSRRQGPAGSEGRWSFASAPRKPPTETERRTALTKALLARHGVLTREAVAAEGVAGGFSAVYPVLKALEEGGQIRRGYFVAGLGATQFAVSGADDRLRSVREPSNEPRTLVLAASDPANPWGAALAWPSGEARPQRAAGAQVILRDGELLGWIGRAESNLFTFLPAAEPERGAAAEALAGALARQVDSGRRRAVLVRKVDGKDPRDSVLAAYLAAAGFFAGSRGYLKRLGAPARVQPAPVS